MSTLTIFFCDQLQSCSHAIAAPVLLWVDKVHNDKANKQWQITVQGWVQPHPHTLELFLIMTLFQSKHNEELYL